MTQLPYEHLPAPPGPIDATAILARLVDGLAFRYRWATEGLRPEDATFRACEGAMTLGEVLVHVHRLAVWVDGAVTRGHDSEPDDIDSPAGVPGDDVESVRAETLATFVHLRQGFLALGDSRLADIVITGNPKRPPEPFWSIVNGPLADALTHVGQINSWRRLAGNPPLRADVFRGNPPPD